MPHDNSASKAGRAALPASWLDDEKNTPIIEQHARRLDNFVAALADGRIDDRELAAQEARLVALMKEVEPQLEPGLRDKVTELLCELTAYDVMQCLNSLESAKPKTKFRG